SSPIRPARTQQAAGTKRRSGRRSGRAAGRGQQPPGAARPQPDSVAVTSFATLLDCGTPTRLGYGDQWAGSCQSASFGSVRSRRQRRGTLLKGKRGGSAFPDAV